MKNIISLISIMALLTLSFGCGHSVARIDRGTGFAFRIPLPDGSSLIDLKLGKIDSVTTVLRGGASYDSVSSTGGSLMGTGGTSDRVQMFTNPGINEGYLQKVLTDKNAPESVKLALATEYLAKSRPVQTLPSRSVSVGSAVGSGDKIDDIRPEAVGIDNAVNKAAEVAPKVVPPITEAGVKITDSVSSASKDIVKDVANTATSVSDGVLSATWKIAIVICLSAVALVVFIVVVYLKFFRKKQECQNCIEDSGEQKTDEQTKDAVVSDETDDKQN